MHNNKREVSCLPLIITILGVASYTVPSGTTTLDVPISYGIMYLVDSSSGGYGLFSITYGTPTKINSKYDDDYTVIKKNNTTVTINYTGSNSSGFYVKTLKI